MRKLIINKSKFKFNDFSKAILDFHSKHSECNPSIYVLKVDADGNGEWGPDEGWDNFLGVLSQGERVYFPFSLTDCGEPIECANGKTYEIDEDSDFTMGDSDTVGFLITCNGDDFIIESAIQAGGGPPFGEYIEVSDCDVFDKPMRNFIDGFVK